MFWEKILSNSLFWVLAFTIPVKLDLVHQSQLWVITRDLPTWVPIIPVLLIIPVPLIPDPRTTAPDQRCPKKADATSDRWWRGAQPWSSGKRSKQVKTYIHLLIRIVKLKILWNFTRLAFENFATKHKLKKIPGKYFHNKIFRMGVSFQYVERKSHGRYRWRLGIRNTFENLQIEYRFNCGLRIIMYFSDIFVLNFSLCSLTLLVVYLKSDLLYTFCQSGF